MIYQKMHTVSGDADFIPETESDSSSSASSKSTQKVSVNEGQTLVTKTCDYSFDEYKS